MKPRRPHKAALEDAAHAESPAAPSRKRAQHAEPVEPKAAVKRATSPQDRAGDRRVRRGKLEIGGRLDLHGHTLQTGRGALMRFIAVAYERGDRTVLVITGVGRAGQGVLKQSLPDWLAAPEIRAMISGFAQAHRVHGGAGAFYVFLKA